MRQQDDVPDKRMERHLQSIPDAHYFWHDHRYKLVAAALPREARTLLDFGCGDGGFLRAVAGSGRGLRLYGYDIGYTPGRTADGTPLDQPFTILSDLAGAKGPFDVITALDVLEHIEDDGAVLATLRSWLSPDGVLILTVPALRQLWSSWDQALGHKRRYNAAALRQVLRQAGFAVARLSYFFSYLCPAVMWRRLVSPALPGSGAIAEFPRLSSGMSGILKILGACERVLLTKCPLPFGSSLIAVATLSSRDGGRDWRT